MLSNVLTAKAISRALLSSYLTRYIKNTNSVATTPLQFRNGMYNFVTEVLHLLCDVFANHTSWHNIYELSLTIDIGLLHMYHLSVLPPTQHTIPLIVSRQISIPNVSPNLTDARYIGPTSVYFLQFLPARITTILLIFSNAIWSNGTPLLHIPPSSSIDTSYSITMLNSPRQVIV